MTPTQTYWKGRPVMYRVLDDTGRLIYVGASMNLPSRMAQHRVDAWWYELIDRVRIQVFPAKDAAFAAETVAIQAERPTFNVKHTGRGERDFAHWTLDDFRVCKAWQDATWARGYLPQAPRHLSAVRA